MNVYKEGVFVSVDVTGKKEERVWGILPSQTPERRRGGEGGRSHHGTKKKMQRSPGGKADEEVLESSEKGQEGK